MSRGFHRLVDSSSKLVHTPSHKITFLCVGVQFYKNETVSLDFLETMNAGEAWNALISSIVFCTNSQSNSLLFFRRREAGDLTYVTQHMQRLKSLRSFADFRCQILNLLSEHKRRLWLNNLTFCNYYFFICLIRYFLATELQYTLKCPYSLH